jgi:ribulose-phosphate 3-epimerase
MNIIPAIIPKSFSDLEEKVGSISDLTDVVQVDICDGKFVSNKNWPIEGNEGEFEKIVSEEVGLPNWEDVSYEIHLMTESPNDEVSEWVKAGAERIIVHIETGSDVVEDIIEEWGHVVEIGISVNMKTDLRNAVAFFDKVQTIQLMGIENIGFQGQKLSEKIYDRVKELRQLGYKHIISIDGGVALENAERLIESGADSLVVGSQIWTEASPREALDKFKKLIGSSSALRNLAKRDK